MHDRVAIFDHVHDRVEVTELGRHDLLVWRRLAHPGPVGQAERRGERRQTLAQYGAKVAGGTGDQQAVIAGHGDLRMRGCVKDIICGA